MNLLEVAKRWFVPGIEDDGLRDPKQLADDYAILIVTMLVSESLDDRHWEPRHGDVEEVFRKYYGRALEQGESAVLVMELMTIALEQHYAVTKNPLYLWEAYAITRRCGLDPPERFLSYLDEVHGRLTTERRKPRASLSGVGARALGLAKQKRGPGTHLTAWLKDWRLIHLAFLVKLQGGKIDAACATVASREQTSRSTVARAWSRFKWEGERLYAWYLARVGADTRIDEDHLLLRLRQLLTLK